MQARSDVKSAKRKAMLNSIFEMWDNEGSGYLDLDEVVGTMKKYKEGVDNAHIDRGRQKQFFCYLFLRTKFNVRRMWVTKVKTNKISSVCKHALLYDVWFHQLRSCMTCSFSICVLV